MRISAQRLSKEAMLPSGSGVVTSTCTCVGLSTDVRDLVAEHAVRGAQPLGPGGVDLHVQREHLA